MADDLVFRPDLYAGTARDYERHRVGYPPAMIADLLGRAAPTGRGRLLDLACGTGQVAFAALDRFAEVWAADQEPDMVEKVGEKAAALVGTRVRAVVSAAEDLEVPEASFELVTVGNAFHRLRRDTVASSALCDVCPMLDRDGRAR